MRFLSKDLAAARARYERAEQTLALLKPPHTSVTAAGDAPSPPPSVYPEPAVKAIMDLQSHLKAEKAGALTQGMSRNLPVRNPTSQ